MASVPSCPLKAKDLKDLWMKVCQQDHRTVRMLSKPVLALCCTHAAHAYASVRGHGRRRLHRLHVLPMSVIGKMPCLDLTQAGLSGLLLVRNVHAVLQDAKLIYTQVEWCDQLRRPPSSHVACHLSHAGVVA